MSFGDRTGPMGQGLGTGRGMGTGRGRGGMGGNSAGAGSVGYCVRPQRGTKVFQQRGIPCYTMICPQCGTLVAHGWREDNSCYSHKTYPFGRR